MLQDAVDAPPLASILAETFPYGTVEGPQGGPTGTLRARVVAGCFAVQMRGGPLMARARPTQAASAGLSDHLKVLWLKAGSGRLVSNGVSADIHAGQAVVVPVGEPYDFEFQAGYDVTALVFNPKRSSRWTELAREYLGKPTPVTLPLQAAAASTAVLLASEDRLGDDAVVIGAVTDLVFHAALGIRAGGDRYVDEGERFLRVTARCVEANLANPHYCPASLARDLGMSRRSLYDRMALHDWTPAAYIRAFRLERSHREIMESTGDRLNLTDLALRNGFSDSSTFSRAFRTRYGLTPRDLLHGGGRSCYPLTLPPRPACSEKAADPAE
jgi:AraC family transcriptional regulator, positive regulator of tynA and feaB